jgi:hypothetical protein
MARLTASARRRVPSRDFAGPGRSFPLTDKKHDRAALSDVGRAEKAGSVTAAQAAKIKSRARAGLGGR